MIEFKKTTFFHAIWFCGGKVQGKGEDWLATIFKEEGQPWKGVYRFRYHASTDPWDENDVKNWYQVTQSNPNDDGFVAKLAETFDGLAKLCEMRYGNPCDKLEVLGDGDKASEMLSKAPWAFTKSESDLNGAPQN
jgi:hypothetical protein